MALHSGRDTYFNWSEISLGSKHFCLIFGVKRDRGTGFSVLAAREMKREPFFTQSLILVPHSLLLKRMEMFATQEINKFTG